MITEQQKATTRLESENKELGSRCRQLEGGMILLEQQNNQFKEQVILKNIMKKHWEIRNDWKRSYMKLTEN